MAHAHSQTALSSDESDLREIAGAAEAERSHATVVEAQDLGRISQERYKLTRLLCARAYFFGILGAVPMVQHLLGPPLCANDISLGCDKEQVLFHCLQSILLSLCFLAPGLVMLYWPVESAVNWTVPMLVLVVCKIAVVNTWMARVAFSIRSPRLNFKIPGLAPIARYLSDSMVRMVSDSDQNVVYFKGQRPFVGFGSEINAWTLVIDTTVPATGIENAVGRSAPIRSLSLDSLYDAIKSKVEGLELGAIRLCRGTYISGEFMELHSAPFPTRYRRPAARLTPSSIENLDQEGNQARQYLSLVSANPDQDLIVSQFVRFQRNGKLIFCEFASHVVPPGKKRLYRLDRFFDTNWLVFSLIGLVVLFAAAVLSVIVSPFIEGFIYAELPWLLAPGSALGDPYFGLGDMLDYGLSLYFVPYVVDQLQNGWFAFRIIAMTLVFLMLHLLWRALRWGVAVLGVFLGLRRQYGRASSFREEMAKGAALDYYELQSVVCFLKSQEKILIGALVDTLDAHGIDTSDIKENLVAFINQGVINSGEIRGNVATKIKSIVFRRSGRANRGAARRGK